MIAQSDLIFHLFGLDHFQIRGPSLHVCERTWSWKPPVFSDFDFWLVLGGEGLLRVNGKPHVLAAGLGFLLQPGDLVEGSKDPDSPLTVFSCHMKPTRRLSHDGRVSAGVLHFRVPDVEIFRRQAGEALRVLQCGDPAPANGLVKLLVAGMVVRAVLADSESPSAAAPPALHKLALEIKSEPGRKWSLSGMARRCFFSVPQFTRKFRRTFAMSPRQFVILQRIRRAIHLLRESRVPIKEIAESLGYSDHFFFHRQFKSIAGVTPLEARRGMPAAIIE
jgi:AraC-like DNA-binding protein